MSLTSATKQHMTHWPFAAPRTNAIGLAGALAGLGGGLAMALVAALNPLLLAIYAPAFIIQHIVYGTVTGLIYAVLRPQPYASMT